MTTAFCKQTHTFIFSDALVVVAYTPISRSRHFEIESEAPVGRNPEVLPLITGAAMSYCCVPGCTSYQRKECDKELSFHRCPMYLFIFFLQNSSCDSTSFIGPFFDICNIKSR